MEESGAGFQAVNDALEPDHSGGCFHPVNDPPERDHSGGCFHPGDEAAHALTETDARELRHLVAAGDRAN